MMIKNSSALNYNAQVLENFKRICFPIFRSSCVKSFRYFRVFEEGHYLNLSTNHEWLGERLEHIPNNGNSFHQPLCSASEDKYTFFLWEHNTQDEVVRLFLKHNIANGVSAYRRKGKSVEVWSFGATKDDMRAANFYINNLDMLKNFISYFNKVAADLIDPSDKSKLATFDSPLPIVSSTQDPKLIDSLEIPHTNDVLSKRELECLSWLSMGKTTKEIANILALSPRTVETYVDNMKKKLNLHKKSELINYFWEGFT